MHAARTVLLVVASMLVNVVALRRQAFLFTSQHTRWFSHHARSTGGPKKNTVDHKRRPNPAIVLAKTEEKLFNMLRQVVIDSKLNITLRVAGGWVRDRLLNIPGKNDVDIAIEGMTGAAFVRRWQTWYDTVEKNKAENSKDQFAVYVIKQNPERSKHLETVTVKYQDFDIDLVNLRSEKYAADSRIPEMQLGTPTEDALRRDLTINSLFYNLHTGKVEDFTGRGLQDLKDGIVRTPLPSVVTLMDDPLRALRIVRFATRFAFAIAQEASTACRDPQVHANLETKVSRERMRTELMAMLHSRAAERAVLLLHSLGLLQCVLKFPTDLYQSIPLQSQNRTNLGSSWFDRHDIVPHPDATAVREEFLLRGVCTVQLVKCLQSVAHHLPRLHERYGEKGSSTGSEKAAKLKRWLTSVMASDDLPKQLWLPALVAASEDVCIAAPPPKQTQPQQHQHQQPQQAVSRAKKYLRLSDDLLAKQLMMSGKETTAITKTVDALAPLRKCLEAYKPRANGPTEHAEKEGDTRSRTEGTPITYRRLTRTAVGNAVIQAGEHYEATVLVAAAQLALRNILTGLKEAQGMSTVDALTMLNGHLATAAGIDLNGGKPNSDCTRAQLALDAPDALGFYETECVEVLEAAYTLLQAIDAMKLQTVWSDNLAPLAGKELRELFVKLPVAGTIYVELKQAQVDWSLEHPKGTKGALVEHLKTLYGQYL